MSPDSDTHLLKIKQEIASAYPDFQRRATKAWAEIIRELAIVTETVAKEGTAYIPQVSYKDLMGNLPSENLKEIRRRGSVVIKDVVDDEQAVQWRDMLVDLIRENPDVDGFPDGNKQFFELYWTKSQVQARSHPNMINAMIFLNNLYHAKPGRPVEGVDLSRPLIYADRFRIRHPGVSWDRHPPHVDGGSIERWEDQNFRKCFDDILSGNWRNHDPYDLFFRLNGRTSLYKRPNAASVFRTFQGWLALSETAPSEGTLKVFPDVLLSNAYMILRPFFKRTSQDYRDPGSWEFDISTPDFPGILKAPVGYMGPRPNAELHPNLELDKTMISVPKVYPGDTVFWHCDVVHAVEHEHTGASDSAVMYIPAMPTTPMNLAYVEKQKQCFIKGARPPDFPQGIGEDGWKGTATTDDIHPSGMLAMGLQQVAVP